METDVPPPVQRTITALKSSLANLTDAAMLSLLPDATSLAAQQKLLELLPLSRPRPSAAEMQARVQADEDAPTAGDFGGDLTVTVTTPYAGLLLVDESFGIECGEDHMLLGYSNASGKWRRILRWQAPPYDKVSGAFGDIFDIELLTPMHEGKPVLLVVHGTPWCTSTMSGFAMDTFAVDPTRNVSTPFWHGEHGYRRADDVPPFAFSLKTTHDGFEIRASVNDWTNAIARVGVMRYRVTAASVERTLPIAMNSRETVEEWLSMQRSEAEHFTDAPQGSLTWKMFDTFTYEGKTAKAETPSMVYGPVRSCTDAPTHFQVEVDSTIFKAGKPGGVAGPRYYVQMRETGTGYMLHDTLADPAAECTGKPIQFRGGYGSSN